MLLSHNHLDAPYYPLGRVYDEANLIVERENSRIITDAEFIRLAVAGILSKEARTSFTKRTKALNIVTKPIKALFER